MKSSPFEVTFYSLKDGPRMADTPSLVVTRADVSLLLAELRDQPSDPLYAPLLEAC
jgi:hypothetical protein